VDLARRDPGPFLRSSLGEHYGSEPSEIDNYALLAAFHEGDEWAGGVIRRAARPLGRVLAMAHALVGVERFILVGGFALALGEAYRLEVARGAVTGCWSLGQDWDSMITLGESDDFAGLIGAGRFAVKQAEAELS
jgi:glucokinase